ncbi:glycosyltransferase family 2 protein [Gaetbulibacter aestuarii]|uniref:Glycosyltransferase family 2 protein n=1 Tax=Gaetbulibacter aestuarii TaxID=1502358 RepID=A0ABW7MZ24_9FLAO
MACDISIIIINYNTANYTIDCIASILKHTPSDLDCEFIIVDNASETKNYFLLKNYIDSISNKINIKLIRSQINTGFGAGNMIGAQQATGNYLAFINNDVIFENDCLSALKEFMDNHENAGVCGPQAFKEDHSILPTIDHFASPLRELFGRNILEFLNQKTYPERKKLYAKPQRGQFVAGSFMFFRTTDFDQVGGFDTNIFLYYEETDICKRLAKNKKSAWLVPSGRFIHFHGASTPKSIALKIELKISLLYLTRKHYGMISYWIIRFYLQLKYFFSSLVKPKHWPLFFALIKGAPLSMSLKHKQKIQRIS